MDSAIRSVEDVELEGYYTAALAFIDPQLTLTTELDAIEAAAAQHAHELGQLPAHLAAADLEQLAEALEFVRRGHGRLATVLEVEDTDIPAGLTVSDLIPAELTEYRSEPAHSNGNGNGNGHHAETNGHASWAVANETEPLAPTAAAIEVTTPAITTPSPLRRRSPLSRIWEDKLEAPTRSAEASEVQALPVLRGLLLIAYEAWLVLFAGWTAVRFRAWPHEPLHFDITLAGHGLFLLGLLTSAVAAWLVYRYRSSTRNIAALIHAGGALVTLNLLAWKLEVARDTLPRITGPGGAHWEILIATWLVCGVAAHIVDLRAR